MKRQKMIMVPVSLIVSIPVPVLDARADGDGGLSFARSIAEGAAVTFERVPLKARLAPSVAGK